MTALRSLVIIFITFISFLASQCLWASEITDGHDTLQTDIVQSMEYPYVMILPNGTRPDRLPDSIYYDIAKGVIFPVNKYVLRSDNAWLQELRTRIKPWAEQNNLQLRYLDVRGASSPEGPVRWNDFLADARSRALQQELERIFELPTTTISVEGHAEDWNALIFMMDKANDPDLPTIRKVLADYAGKREVIKQKIKALEGGRLWNRVFDKYFALIRYARVVLYFEQRALPVEVTPFIGQLVAKNTQNLSDSVVRIEIPDIQIEMPEELVIDRFPRRHLLAVRTNLLYDAFYMPRYGMAPTPNLSLEFYPKIGHFTYNISGILADWERWNVHKFWQIQDINAGVRFYTRRTKKAPRDVRDHPLAPTIADRFLGLYVGAYAHINRFGIGLDKDTGWEGEGWGAGLQVGYTLPLCKSNRWRMEFSLGAGFYSCVYDPYVWGNPVNGVVDGKYYYNYQGPTSKFIRRNHRFTWFGPTELGIHLTYDLLYWRGNGKKGASFRRWAKNK